MERILVNNSAATSSGLRAAASQMTLALRHRLVLAAYNTGLS